MDVKKPCPGQESGWDKFHSQFNGYTLIELLITLAVISILIVNVLPSLSSLVARERTVSLTNNLSGDLAFARSESVTKNQIIISCQSIDGSNCNKSGNWHNGWIIFADLNNDKKRNTDETLLRVFQPVNNGTEAVFNGAANIDHYIKYKPTGHAYPNGSFLICNPEIGNGKALIMTQSGRLRLSSRQRDGSAITC